MNCGRRLGIERVYVVFAADLWFNMYSSLKTGGETGSTGIKKLRLHTEVLSAR
jgi:hypothetical protein